MSLIGVILAAAAGFGFGAVWYMTLGRVWMDAVGLSEEELRGNPDPVPFILGFVAALSTAGLLRHMLVSGGVTGVFGSAVSGFGLGLFAVAPWIVLNYAFARRPRILALIDGLHVVGACTVIGLVLGFFI